MVTSHSLGEQKNVHDPVYESVVKAVSMEQQPSRAFHAGSGVTSARRWLMAEAHSFSYARSLCFNEGIGELGRFPVRYLPRCQTCWAHRRWKSSGGANGRPVGCWQRFCNCANDGGDFQVAISFSF